MIRYLIWDAGGTLFDTYPAVVEACRLALYDFGKVVSSGSIWPLCRQSIGYALQTLADRYALEAETLTQHYEELYAEMDVHLQPPFPGVVEICRYMCDSGGQNFIVTHRAWSSLTQLLDVHNMRAYFTDCITKDDPYPRKPDPSAILHLLDRYNLVPEFGVAIGDRDLDIVAAQRAGLRTCWFGTGVHQTKADMEIQNFTMFYQWLIAENEGAEVSEPCYTIADKNFRSERKGRCTA